jgi:hypothetical protein
MAKHIMLVFFALLNVALTRPSASMLCKSAFALSARNSILSYVEDKDVAAQGLR